MNKIVITTLFLIFAIPIYLHSQFDSSYDSRTYGYVTPVKDQGPTCGACWAFTSCAAIESSWLKQGYGSYDLSEDNLTDCHDFDPGPCDWGNFYMTNALLSKHLGILTEANDAYTTGSQDCPFSLTFPPAPAAYVEEIRFIEANNNDIKQAILDYGAVGSSMFFNGIPANWDGVNYKYYDPTIGSEDEPYAHCVTIIGWDDNLVFSGAPSNGGWIIKDSYGTTWADNGYFYCSYYDAGILSSNVVFPSKVDIPPTANTPHAYYYDDFGWVNNYGFSSNEAYALIKYTLLPNGGDFSGQQIKRIGTYAVTKSSNIEIGLYRTKSGNTLSDLITTSSVNCPEAGYYTIPLDLKTDTLGSTIYIKVKYTSDAGHIQPIPIEENEAFSSSGFTATNGLCWISSDGNNWTQTGVSTAYDFDLCIKMYTEGAPTAKMSDIPESICQSELVMLDCESMPFDSVKWYANDILIGDMPSLPYNPMEFGTVSFKLVVWLGQNSDTAYNSIIVNELPDMPTIYSNWVVLTTDDAFAYQWFTGEMEEIVGETEQLCTPMANGTFIVRVFNEYGCFSDSEPFHFISEDISQEINKEIKFYPNPVSDVLNIEITDSKSEVSIYDISGKLVWQEKASQGRLTVDVSKYAAGIYTIKSENKKETKTIRFIKN